MQVSRCRDWIELGGLPGAFRRAAGGGARQIVQGLLGSPFLTLVCVLGELKIVLCSRLARSQTVVHTLRPPPPHERRRPVGRRRHRTAEKKAKKHTPHFVGTHTHSPTHTLLKKSDHLPLFSLPLLVELQYPAIHRQLAARDCSSPVENFPRARPGKYTVTDLWPTLINRIAFRSVAAARVKPRGWSGSPPPWPSAAGRPCDPRRWARLA